MCVVRVSVCLTLIQRAQVTQCLLSQVSERQAAYSDKEGYGERVCLIFTGSVWLNRVLTPPERVKSSVAPCWGNGVTEFKTELVEGKAHLHSSLQNISNLWRRPVTLYKVHMRTWKILGNGFCLWLFTHTFFCSVSLCHHSLCFAQQMFTVSKLKNVPFLALFLVSSNSTGK